MINMMTKEEENRRERGIDIEEFVFIGGDTVFINEMSIPPYTHTHALLIYTNEKR